MKLERKWARLTLVFLLMVLLSLGQILVSQGHLFMVIASVLQTLLFAAASLAVWRIGLRCTHCGKTCCPPRWSPGKRFYCSNCDEPFVFDDEEERR